MTGLAITFFAALFVSLITMYGVSNWLATLFDHIGVTAGGIALINTVAQTGGLVGSIVGARLIMGRPPLRTAALFYLPAALMLAAYTLAGHQVPALALVAFFGQFFLIGAQNILNATTGAVIASGRNAPNTNPVAEFNGDITTPVRNSGAPTRGASSQRNPNRPVSALIGVNTG